MNRIAWTSDRPDVVLDGTTWERGAPMPHVRNVRASAPWAEVHRERGTRNRARRRVDHAVALAWSLAHDDAAIDAALADDTDDDIHERLALAELRARNGGAS